MHQVRTAETAWCALLAAVTIYELTAAPDQLLSEGVDRRLDRHPILTRTAIAVTALHLANLLPRQLDPFSLLARLH